MSYVDVVAAAQAILDAVPADGLRNGDPYVNATMPSTSHIADVLKWPLLSDGSNAPLEDHICSYAATDLDAAGRTAAATAVEIDVAVIVAVARCAAWRFYNLTAASLNPNECARAAPGAVAKTVHPDHQPAVGAALGQWASAGARYLSIAVYNAISYETTNHHHLPAATRKLATTTIAMSGLSDWLAGGPTRESAIFHDMFHPLSDVTKSNLARDVNSKPMLSGTKFDNLRKRVPVKAPDSGLALNYAALYAKAKSYRHVPGHVPDTLEPPAALFNAVTEYEGARTAADLVSAVARLRKLSEALAEPSAYLAGFILGREAAAVSDPDLTLRTAKRAVTILGSPAYARVAGDYSGTFASGKESGYQAVPQNVPDQVIPRCEAAITTAATL